MADAGHHEAVRRCPLHRIVRSVCRRVDDTANLREMFARGVASWSLHWQGMTWPVVRTVSFAIVGALWGCGFDSADSPPSRADQCRDFVAGYCAKMTECALPSDRSRAKDDCDFNFEVYLSCDAVISVQGSMQKCLDALEAIDCASIVPAGGWPETPQSCRILVTR